MTRKQVSGLCEKVMQMEEIAKPNVWKQEKFVLFGGHNVKFGKIG